MEIIRSITMNETAWVALAIGVMWLALVNLAKHPTYGLEIEAIRRNGITQTGLAAYLSNKFGVPIRYRGYTHDGVTNWKIVDDGSLSSMGTEIVSPISTNADMSLIRRIVAGLKGLASANRECGLHVHHGIIKDGRRLDSVLYGQDFDEAVSLAGWVGRILYAYNYYQSVIDAFLAPSRRNGRNQYAQTLDHLVERFLRFGKPSNFEQHFKQHYLGDSDRVMEGFSKLRHLFDSLCYDRYMNVNLCALGRYGTVEFRQHHGTTNPNQVQAWVEFTQALVMACREPWSKYRHPRSYENNLNGLFGFLGLRKSPLAAFYGRRTRAFAGTLISGCSNCGQPTCDQDEYCPHKRHSTPSDYDRHSDEGYDEDIYGSVSLFGMVMIMLAPLAFIVNCGIGAYHHASRANRKAPYGVKKAIKRLFAGLTSRGTDAAGFAISSIKGTVRYFKQPIPATAKAMNKVFNKEFTSDSRVALLHTRYATHGGNTELNAHPHFSPQSRRIIMVHNGMISDHAKVFKALKVEPLTQCDSEAAAACLEAGGIKTVVKHCTGSMSLLWIDHNEPNVLNAWTNGGNPLAFGRLDHPKTGPVVFGSTVKHLEDAFKGRLKSKYDAAIGRHYKVSPDGVITHTDIEGSADTAYTWTYNYGRNNYYPYSTRRTYSWQRQPKPKMDNDEVCIIDTLDTTDGLHDYDPETHEGIRPDGTRYTLASWVKPTEDPADLADLRDGMFDDPMYYDDWYDMTWS